MDAKVIRAAVSAAIRVTVSTTLMGCGGSVVAEAGGAGGSPVNGSAGNGAATQTVSGGSDQRVVTDPPVSGGGTTSNSVATSGGVATGASAAAMAGAATEDDAGGLASAAGAGQAGESSSAGAPGEVCGDAVAACLTLIEPELASQESSDAGKACCDTIISGLDDLRLAGAPCYGDLDRRFMSSGVRQRCCADQATWIHPACTPWGPPVPPELPAAALRAWSLAA